MKKVYIFLLFAIFSVFTYAGDGSKKTEALTVAEAMAKNNDGKTYWVEGYIVGVCTSGTYSSATIGSTESESNFLIADTPTPSGAEECMPVALPSQSAARTEINLEAHPEYIGKEIAVYGRLAAYFNVNGIKETSTYAFMDEVSNIIYDNELLGDKGGFEEYYMHYGEGLTYAWYNQKNYGWTASAFKSNACVPCESWLVSPAFDLSDATDPVFSFSQVVNKLGEGHSVSDHCSVWVSANFTDSVGTATWTEVTIPTWPAGTSWDFFKTGDISLKQWAGRVIRIGFKYVTDTQSAPSWEIKNLQVIKARTKFINPVIQLKIGSAFEYEDKWYVIASENLIENPDFNNGLEGWVGGAGGALANTEVESSGGVDNGAYIIPTSNRGKGDNSSIGMAWEIEKGKTYVFSYFINNVNGGAAVEKEGYIVTSQTDTPRGDETMTIMHGHEDANGVWTQNIVVTEAQYNYLQFCARWLNGTHGFDSFFLAEVRPVATITGTDGGLIWTIDTVSGVLSIYGTGGMSDFNRAPWYESRSYIRKVSISEGVTRVGSYAFRDCENLSSIIIPETVTSIETTAFSGSSPSVVVNLSDCNVEVSPTCKIYTKETLIFFEEHSFAYSGSSPVPTYTKGSAPFTVSMLKTPSLEKNAGTYTASYKFHFSDGDLDFYAIIPYTYTITPAPVTVNVTSTSREYGDVNPEFDYIVNGLFESDAIDVTLTAPDYRSKAGSYSFTASTTAKNYSIVNTTGTLTITKAPLTVTADSYTKTYGNANPKFTARYQGFKNGESSSVLTASPTISSQATVSSPVGEYAITASGGAAQNYEFTEYVPGTLTITKAPLTITADNVSRLYFEDAEYTFRSKGWKNNEDASVLTAQPTIQCAAGKTSPVGVYDIVPSGAEAQNYNISYQNGSLTIGKRTLTVKAKDVERYYGEENPEFECSFGGFVNDETAAVLTTMPEAVTTAEQWSDVGTYSIVMQGGEATNYKFSYVNGQLSVLRAPQKIEWEQELGTVAVGSQVLLTAKATSGLEIEFKYDAELAEIYPTFDGLVLDCLKEGVLTIRATQDGNQNYHPAERVVKTLNIVSTGIAPVIQEGEDAIYDLQGRKVLEAVKGFYLQNGKKVYRK